MRHTRFVGTYMAAATNENCNQFNIGKVQIKYSVTQISIWPIIIIKTNVINMPN